MSKHTPGPWIPGAELVTTERGRTIADCGVHLGVGENENKHNMRLIAAAPELLEAAKIGEAILEGIFASLRKVDPRMALEEKREYLEWMRLIQAAIAKAEGK